MAGSSKIKKEVIVKQYFEGGLKMINLKAFVQGLKITWVKRLLTKSSQWQHLISHTINLNSIINCIINCGQKYTDSVIKDIKNLFFFKAYSIFLECNTLKDGDNLLCSSIYHNPSIVVGGREIFYPEWYKKGIILVTDLLIRRW